MALLGSGGELELSREAPPLTIITDTRFDSGKLWLTEPGYWPGDRVLLSCPRGLPLDFAGNGYADCPDGHRHWGGQGVTGPATAHRTDDSGPYWAASDSVPFWETASGTGLTTQLDCYVGRDTLGRLSFYNSEINAVNGGTTGKFVLTGVEFGALIISAYSAGAVFQAALATLAQALQALLPFSNPEQPVEKVAEIPESLASPDLIGWKIQANLAQWTLDQESGTQDTTALSESYGDSVKALVRGSGTLQFDIDRTYRNGYQDTTALLRLVMMLNRGCRTRAKFFLCRNQVSDPVVTSPVREPKLGGALWYEADLLLAKTGVQTAASEFITGSAAFLVVGETQLKMGA
jgi:hypothetical protein